MLFSPGDLVKTSINYPKTKSIYVLAYPNTIYPREEVIQHPKQILLSTLGSILMQEATIGQVVDTIDNLKDINGSHWNLVLVLFSLDGERTKLFWVFEENLLQLDYTPLA